MRNRMRGRYGNGNAHPPAHPAPGQTRLGQTRPGPAWAGPGRAGPGQSMIDSLPCWLSLWQVRRGCTLKRAVYKPLGLLFLALGLVGIVLPILPSTPFVLLAAWFFAQSSEKWHAKLLDSELFGPMIRNWEANRCVSLRTKIVALGAMAIAGGASIAFAIQDPRLRVATAALMGVGIVTILLLKTCPECREQRQDGRE